MSELLRAVMQITDTVYPMYKAYIEPDLNTAHLKIYNNFNPFSGFMAPTYILKSAKRVVPEQIKAVLQVRALLHMLSPSHCSAYHACCHPGIESLLLRDNSSEVGSWAVEAWLPARGKL